jgi:transcriptional regulator with XRE-family HTH domain
MTLLKAKRSERGLTQSALALLTKIQPSLISRYEAGQAPNQVNAMKLAAALGCPVEKIYPEFLRLRSF